MTTMHDRPLVWERPEPVTPAGRPAAGTARITAAAFEIADKEGLQAVSVKRVASRLKVGASAIAHYVTDRDDLFDLMLDAAFGEIALPGARPGDDWRMDLRAIAYATQAMAVHHPWVRTLVGTRTPAGPNGLRFNERTLAALAGLGLPAGQILALANTVLAFVYGFVQLEMGHQLRGKDVAADASHQASTAQRLTELAASGSYPLLAELIGSGAAVSTDAAFEAGLDIVLDGIALRIDGAAD